MKKLFYPASLILLCLILSGWGSKGHKKISQNAAACLPVQMSFLKPVWTNYILSHASDADYRKDQDPDEATRHYIDIDYYPEFVLSGLILQNYDSIIALHGYNFVIDNGTLPWTTKITFDSLKSCFQRRDWNKSAYFAADLGHYVGDGHMPLHITKNYNGQMTGQSGIHSRYETSMISRYEAQIIYPADSAQMIPDVQHYIFEYLYHDYLYVDSILLADSFAKTASGSITSDAYYQALWAKSGSFTIQMMRTGSNAFASLIYTAWVQAGSPLMFPNAVEELALNAGVRILQNYPNPAHGHTIIPVELPDDNYIKLSILDATGRRVEVLADKYMHRGRHDIRLNTETYPDGLYLVLLQAEDGKVISKSFTVKN